MTVKIDQFSIEDTPCPNCGGIFEGMEGPAETRPLDGSLTACTGCAAILRMHYANGTWTFSKVSREEFMALREPVRVHFTKVMMAIMLMNAESK